MAQKEQQETLRQAVLANDIDWMKKSLANIEQAIRDMNNVFSTKVEMLEVEKIQIDHESRLRGIEKNMFRWIGMASVLSSGIGIAVAYLMKNL